MAQAGTGIQRGEPILSDIPGRLDALPWSRWHLLIVLALGITWVLDGLEITLAGAAGATLMDRRALGLTEFQVGLSATFYLAGALLMLLAAGCEAILGVKAERRSLEDIAPPLSSG